MKILTSSYQWHTSARRPAGSWECRRHCTWCRPQFGTETREERSTEERSDPGLHLLPVGHGTDLVVDGLALLLVDGGALLLVLGPAGRGPGLSVPGGSPGRSRRGLRRGSVAGGGSVGGVMTTPETAETNPIRTSFVLVLERPPPTLLSKAESQ